jgi:lipopolysaccharide transport system ATP-binding protein
MDRLVYPDESGNLATPNESDTSARPVAHGDLTVGITGTFDVENYGDLLFPLIAADALKRRDPRIRVKPFSVQGRSVACWRFQVRTVEEMIESLSTFGGAGRRWTNSVSTSCIPRPRQGIQPSFACWLAPRQKRPDWQT